MNYNLFFYRLLSIMKQNHKRKTYAFQKNSHELLLHKRKHNSTATFIPQDQNKLLIFDVIEYLLNIVFQKEKVRGKFAGEAIKKLAVLQNCDNLYFNLEMADNDEIRCQEDAQPPHQENRSLEVVKKHLKRSSRRFNDEAHEISEANGSRMSILDVDKKDRDGIIQKLKKQYSMILQSKYESENTPIGQSRTYFAEIDTPEIANMRKNYGKCVTKKQPQKHKPSFIQEQIRKNHKLNTIFKRSKDFVETIDPTMSNSMYVSMIQPQTSSQRNSVANLPSQQPQVIVKLSKFKEITNSIKTTQEMTTEQHLPLAPTGQNNTKFINLISEQERQALKQRVERSFHSNERMKFREVLETQRKPRLNNAISVSFLPRIARI